MAEKLVGIVREYDLEMHTWSSQALTDADFADAAGLTEELSVTEVYDTGAFIAAGTRPVPFELHYMPKGSLYTGGWRIFFFLDDVGPVRGPETAESWMYVNAFGNTVCCVDAGWGSSLVIYETPQAYVMAISFGTERTDTAPGAASGGDYAAERLADSIEFSKLK